MSVSASHEDNDCLEYVPCFYRSLPPFFFFSSFSYYHRLSSCLYLFHSTRSPSMADFGSLAASVFLAKDEDTAVLVSIILDLSLYRCNAPPQYFLSI
jgi:hypothetical protein